MKTNHMFIEVLAKALSIGLAAAFALAVGMGTVALFGTAEAQTTSPDEEGGVSDTPEPGTTEAPMVIEVDSVGNVLIRGTAASVDQNSMTIDSWGGMWTISTDQANAVVPSGADPNNPGDLSGISPGDFVGVEGTFSENEAMTVDASFVRNWTTDPFPGAFTGAAVPDSDTGETGAPVVSPPDTTDTAGNNTTDTDTTDIYAPDTSDADDTTDTTLMGGDDQNTAEEGDADPATGDEITYSGAVDSIDGMSITFTDDFDSTYTVDVESDLPLVDSNNEVITIEDIEEGDTIEVEGVADGDTISASIVRLTSDNASIF